jgi:hypothetical protein
VDDFVFLQGCIVARASRAHALELTTEASQG